MRNYSVYVLSSPGGKRYIGMTMRKTDIRWRNGKGYTNNKRLYADIVKHGWDSFNKEIIAQNLTKEEAEELERDLIKKYETQNPEQGYNIEMGGTPIHLAESTRQKMSISHKGLLRDAEYRKHISESKQGCKNGMYGKTGALNPKSRKVIAIRNGEVLEFDAISEASRSLNLSPNAFKNISAACMGKRKTAYGYKWEYVNDN